MYPVTIVTATLTDSHPRMTGALVQRVKFQIILRGNFFQCHVFAMKSVQNLKSFWRSSQNYFVLALFSSL
jgi:hypothetical protein